MKFTTAIILLLFSSFSLWAKDNQQLYFLENKGQIVDQRQQLRTDIDFKLEAGALNIFIGKGTIYYQWMRPVADEDTIKENNRIAYQRLEAILIGANKNATYTIEEIQPYYENHFLKNGEEVSAKSFRKITYKNIYPNIDWVLYTNAQGLKYDFIVHEGGNTNDIQIQYKGAKNIQLHDGALHITTSMGSITEQAPYTYDAITQQPINSKFILTENTLGFDVVNHNGNIVIDPTLEWATYYGGTNKDIGTCSATDQEGNVYMGGETASINNIATTGTYQDTLAQTLHVGYVIKFNTIGIRQWATYYPGYVNSIACDKNMDVYFTGNIFYDTTTYNIATNGAHQTSYGGHNTNYNIWIRGDAYLAKFDASGNRIWATYYGDTSGDISHTVVVDQNEDVYIGGVTGSINNITTSGSHQQNINPSSVYMPLSQQAEDFNKVNGFIVKFDSTGSRIWATYYGNIVTCLNVDAYNNIYAVGYTSYNTGIATTNAHKTNYSGQGWHSQDGFIVKFNSSGVRQWGTYYGDIYQDRILSIASSPTGSHIYIVGETSSNQNIATTGSHMDTYTGYGIYVGRHIGYLAKLDSAGNRIWGTYYGGNFAHTLSSGVIVTPSNRIFISGMSNSNVNIATSSSYQTSLGGGYDNYITEFSPTGSLVYSTYYGGNKDEMENTNYYSKSRGLSYSVNGKIHLSSSTESFSGIATVGAHQTQKGIDTSSPDAYLATFAIDNSVYFLYPFNDTNLCTGDTIRIPYGVSGHFSSGNSFFVQLSNSSGSFLSPTTIGYRIDSLADTITCVIPYSMPSGTGYKLRINSNTPTYSSPPLARNITITAPPNIAATNNGPVCTGDSLQLFANANSTNGSFSWAGPNNFTASSQDTFILNTDTTHAGNYILTSTLGLCSNVDSTTVVMKQTPLAPIASSNSTVCPNTTLNLYATDTATNAAYSWTGPSSFTDTAKNPTRTNATTAMAGVYAVTSTVNGCTSEPDTTTVVVAITTPTPVAASNAPLCSGQALSLTTNTINNATYAWTGPALFTSNLQNPTILHSSTALAGTYYVTATVNGCISLDDSVVVVVNPPANIGIYPTPSDTICAGDKASFTTLTQHAGNTPVYTWLKNNTIITGVTGTVYNTTTINDGDIISCVLSNVANCPSYKDTSNAIDMTVLPWLTPSVSITASPSLLVAPWELVSFTATPVNGGATPTYQWRRNGQDVIGATNNVWGTFQLSDGDTISVVLYSDYKCPNPDSIESNKLVVNLKLGIDNINALNSVTLFPNPNNGTFTIKGKVTTKEDIRLSIINGVGQVVHQQTIKPTNSMLNEQINTYNLASGVYLLQLQAGNDKQHIRFTIR